MPSIDDKIDSDEEDMDQESQDSDKSDSRASDSASGSDDDESSDIDEVESERRRNECVETMSALESQFSQLKEQLYREKLTQVIEKLREVEAEEASEYLNPIAQLEENRKTRLSVANIRSQLRQKNIENVCKAEEQAAQQNFESEKNLLYDILLLDLHDKIKRLEEDRHSVDITSDMFAETQALKKRRQNTQMTAADRRRKPVTVTGPYIVYMLRESEIREDWAAIMLAVKQSEENLRVHDVLSNQRGSFQDIGHVYAVRYCDGKLQYEGATYDINQRIIIETRNSPSVHARIVAINDKSVTVRQSDDTDSRLFISQLQLGKYTIRQAS